VARAILIIAAIIEIVFRGLPGLFGSEPIAKLFGLEYIPGALPYVHPLGALMLVFGVAYYMASKDPVKYKFIIDLGILRYALTAVSHVITLVMLGSMTTFWYAQLVVDVVLLVLFIVSRPKTAAT